MQNNRNLLDEGANPLKDLTHANLNEPLKQHNANAVKLVQTVSEFAQALGGAMECHGQNVIRLVDDFRGRTSDSRGDTNGMRRVWDSLLRQVEADAAAHLELASVLQQQLSRPALEGCFHRKVQHRKVFTHREAYEQVIAKTEEKLQRARAEYKRAYGALLAAPETSQDSELKRAYLEAHNAYVLQLRATNAISERYQFHCLPGLLGEVAEVYEELCGLTCTCVSGISEAAGDRVAEQIKRYQALAKEVKVVNPQSDLQVLARSLSSVAQPRKPPRRLFVPPSPPEQASSERINSVPALRDELVATGSGTLGMMEEDLKLEADRLAQEIAHLQDALDTLNRMQRKSAEGNLYTKVAELQEDISMKRFDLGVAQLHLAAVHAQAKKAAKEAKKKKTSAKNTRSQDVLDDIGMLFNATMFNDDSDDTSSVFSEMDLQPGQSNMKLKRAAVQLEKIDASKLCSSQPSNSEQTGQSQQKSMQYKFLLQSNSQQQNPQIGPLTMHKRVVPPSNSQQQHEQVVTPDILTMPNIQEQHSQPRVSVQATASPIINNQATDFPETGQEKSPKDIIKTPEITAAVGTEEDMLTPSTPLNSSRTRRPNRSLSFSSEDQTPRTRDPNVPVNQNGPVNRPRAEANGGQDMQEEEQHDQNGNNRETRDDVNENNDPVNQPRAEANDGQDIQEDMENDQNENNRRARNEVNRNKGNKRTTKTMKEFVMDCIRFYKATQGPGHEDHQHRYTIDNDEVYLGEGRYVNLLRWEMMQLSRPTIFLIEVAQILWDSHDLANRALNLTKPLENIPGRSPIKLIEPNRLRLLISLYHDFLDRNKCMDRINKMEHMLKATYVLRHKIRTLRATEKKARAERDTVPDARKRLRFDYKE